MHGLGGNPQQQRYLSGFDTLADSEGFIVAWPYGIEESWNDGEGWKCCQSNKTNYNDDVDFIRNLITTVSKEYNVDLKRVYVTGESNGCAMAQRIANDASDIIAASACMAMFLVAPSVAEYTPVSIMQIHGTADNVISYTGSKYLPSALENFNRWKEMNNCTGTYTETWRQGNHFTNTYKNCDNSTEVSMVTLYDVGHAPYKGADTDIDTTQMAWDFMKRFSK